MFKLLYYLPVLDDKAAILLACVDNKDTCAFSNILV